MQAIPGAPLLAAGFASSLMLLWTAAAAIPILIHLLTRRRQRSIPWAAMQLLRNVIESESKRIRFEQLLLLLIRAAILVVLALALARPYLEDPPLAVDDPASSVSRLWILAVDVSYSMGYRSEGSSRIQVAKDTASEIIREGKQGDAYVLIEMGSPARARIRRPTFDQDLALGEVRRLQVLDTHSDILGGLRLASEIAAEAKRNERLPDAVRTIVISDAGRDAWEPVLQNDRRALLTQLTQDSDLQVVSLTTDNPQNIAITSLVPSTFRSLIGQPLTLAVRLENFSSEEVRQLPVQLTVDGKTLESKFVDIPANSAAMLTFSYTPNRTGLQVLAASIAKDNLSADNDRCCVIAVEDQHRILFVEQAPNSTQFLQLSLAPDFASDLRSPFQKTSKIELLSQNLDEWDAIVVDDLSSVDGVLIERLARYARGGGRLIMNFGAKTQSAAWNSGGLAENLLGFRFNEPSRASQWTLDPLDYRSPVVAIFSGYPESGLLTTPIFRFWKIAPEADELEIDLATSSGDPLIVRHRLQRGWVASLLSAPDSALRTNPAEGLESWNAMATWPSFVPLMSQLMKTLLNSNADETNLTTGQPLVGERLSPDVSTVDIITPEGVESKVVCSPEADSPTMGWQYDRTVMHGVYLARSTEGTTTPYAVNLNPVESSLEAINLEQLPTTPSSSPAGSDDEGDDTDPQLGYALARWLLIALLGLLIAESTFAWTIGRRIG